MRVNALLKPCGKPFVALLVLLVLGILVPACAPKKLVSIPPEWQKPPPPTMESPKVPEVPAAGSKPTAILKPPPAIKESDIAVSAETPAKAPEKKAPQPSPPQHAASMHLVDQAKASLAQGKPDPAIPLLEQAIQIDVHNGEAFFSLARAWRMKGSRLKALQFSQKAELLFQDDRGKLKQVYLFEADLYKEMGETAKMDAYRQKASKLK
jgi:hypothetical protein